MHDVVVVGGGHNGLSCVAYLAKAGKRVIVLEAWDKTGGFVASQDMAAEGAPGFIMSPYALDHFLTNVPPSVIDELGLSRYGLEMVDVDPWISWVGPDGGSISLHRDRAKSIEQIARYSKKDAEQYDKFCTLTKTIWELAVPYFQGHPTRPKPQAVAQMLRIAAKKRRDLLPLARFALSSAESVLDEWFEREEVKALLATLALSVMAPLHAPATALFLTSGPAIEKWGYRRAVGGAGRFAAALEAAAQDLGVEVRSSAPVREIFVDRGRAAGAVLDNGEIVRGAQVVAAVDPMTLNTKLLDPSLVPEQVTRELRGMQVAWNNLSGFTGHMALSARPQVIGGRIDELLTGSLILAPDYQYVRRGSEAWTRGEITSEIPMFMCMPSVIDRTVVPPGSDGDYCYVWPCAAPYELSDGRVWAEEKDKWLEQAIHIMEGYAPGISETVIATKTFSPADLASHVYKGFLYHVDLTPSQMGPFRPIPSMSGYKTCVEGLWHTGAGSHPFGLQSGLPGRITAATVAKATKGRAARRAKRTT